MCRKVITASFIIALLSLLPASGQAWVHDLQVNQVISDTGYSVDGEIILSDGSGGFYVVWKDDRQDGFPGIYGQRLDAQGNPLWRENGASLVYNSPYTFNGFTAVTGDDGSLWIATSMTYPSPFRIYVQNVSADGTARFGLYGIATAPNAPGGWHTEPVMVTDGENGVIVAWKDNRDSGTTGYDIYAQRIGRDTGRMWDSAGQRVCAEKGDQGNISLVRSQEGATLCFWGDTRMSAMTGLDIYGECLDRNGNPLWSTSNGRAIIDKAGDQVLGNASSDGHMGAVFSFTDDNGGATVDHDIYIHRVDAQGYSPWPTGGTPVCTAEGYQNDGFIASDGDGGAFLFWRDNRPNAFDGQNLYGQRVYGNGQVAWTENGILLFARHGTAAYGDHRSLVAVDDGGLFVVSQFADVAMLQKVDESGMVLFGSGGRVISSYSAGLDDAQICSDGRGGVIACWADGRSRTHWSSYVQRVDRWGLGGAPEPAFVSVEDRPNDQGGEVVLTWEASPLDTFADPIVNRYSAWMRLPDAPLSKSLPEGDVQAAVSASGLGEGEVKSMMLSGWAYAGGADAMRFESYGLHVPTYGDSTSAGSPVTVYQILAHDDDRGANWASTELSGWSVDNLAPGAPLALSANRLGVDVGLSWMPSGLLDEDLAEYHVHRSAEAGFSPSPATLVGAASDTLYTDASPPPGLLYYLVTAVDVHGNESVPSNEAALAIVTGVDSGPPQARTALLGAYPNPFNPSTKLSFELAAPAHARLRIYDAAGRLVTTLVNEARQMGRHEVTWDGRDAAGQEVASGVYLYRLEAGTAEESRRMTLVK